MLKRQPSKDELLCLLGNCVLAIALSDDEKVLVLAKTGAEKHARELHERFPGWEEDYTQKGYDA